MPQPVIAYDGPWELEAPDADGDFYLLNMDMAEGWYVSEEDLRALRRLLLGTPLLPGELP